MNPNQKTDSTALTIKGSPKATEFFNEFVEKKGGTQVVELKLNVSRQTVYGWTQGLKNCNGYDLYYPALSGSYMSKFLEKFPDFPLDEYKALLDSKPSRRLTAHLSPKEENRMGDDGMSPRIERGDELILGKEIRLAEVRSQIANGDICYVAIKGKVYVRMVNKKVSATSLDLVPLNKKYAIQTVSVFDIASIRKVLKFIGMLSD